MSNHPPQKRAFMRTFIITAFLVACLIATPARADLGDELFKFTASDAAAGDQFGYSVAISGNEAIIGSPYDGNDNLGSAYVFDLINGQELFKLSASDASPSGWFGLSVDLSGNTAIVGAPNDGNTGPLVSGFGSAYLFDVGTGQELRKLVASDAALGDAFGRSVAISGNTAIVGAYGNGDVGDFSGSAYLFNVATGQELFKLTASDAAPLKQFGGSVAISGNVAIIGAQEGNIPGTDPGSAYLFNAMTGQELLKITASDGAAGDQFGVSVAISGNLAIVGALRDDDVGRNSGAAYLFDVTTGQELFKLTAADGVADDLFGVSVALSGNLAIVGATSDADGGIGSGSAYVFDVTTGSQIAKFTASDATANDHFGFALAVAGNLAVIGAAYDDNYTGSAYVFFVPEPGNVALFALVLPLIVRRNAWRFGHPTVRGRRSVLGAVILAPASIHRLSLVVITTLAADAVVGVRLANAAAGDIYNLGTLGGTSSAGYDINDAGQVVGFAQDAVLSSRAFLWESSRGMTNLGTTNGYTEAHAHAISTSGSVVGAEYAYGTGVRHAFAWTPNEPNSTTGTMTSLTRDDSSTAKDINAAGLVVGSSTNVYFVDDGSCTPDHPYYPNCGPGGTWKYETRAVLWENGLGTDLTSPGFILETANAINNEGQVTGQTTAAHAFRYDGTPSSGGILHDLGTLGGTTSIGNAINDAGQVVGDSWTTGDTDQHAFRYTGTPGSGGVMVDLDTLGGTSSHAYDINDAGFVVGVADRAAGTGGGTWAALWKNDAGNTAVDLDAWLDATNPILGAHWVLTEARGINNNGLITGQGIYDDGPDGLSDGYRAFVLDVSGLVPEPTIPGDYNLDGTVDAADYVVWRKGLDTTYSQNDYNIWRANFGRTAGSGAALPSAEPLSAAVPEPVAWVMLLIGMTAMLVYRDLVMS